jgi:peroxidase
MATVLRICFVLALMTAWVTTRANPSGSLRPDYYIWTCPQAEAIVFSGVQRAIAQEARMAGSLLRLHFHDCFVNVSNSIYLQIFMISVCCNC